MNENFGQFLVVVIGGEIDWLQVVVGGGITGEPGFEHIDHRRVVLHPGGFGEKAKVLLGQRRRGWGGGFVVPELVEPVVEFGSFGSGFTEVGTAEANCLAAGGVVVDVNDIGAGAVAEEKIDHGTGATAADGVVETHFAVAGAGAEVGVGAVPQHELGAFEIFEVELAEKAVAEPGRLEFWGSQDRREDGVVGVFAGVVEGFIVVGVGTGVEEEFGDAAKGVFGSLGRLGGEMDEALGGKSGVVGEEEVEGAEVGG
jgi:hypothetical protein